MKASDNDWNTQYDNERDYKWTPTSRLTHILSRVSVSRKDRALDVGCGTGQLCRDLLHRGIKVKGVDISRGAIEQANQSTLLSRNEIEFTICDIENDEIDTGKFDLIFCKYVLTFIANKDNFLKVLHRSRLVTECSL